MFLNDEMKKKLGLISNVPEDKLIEEKIEVGKLAETYVSNVKEIVVASGGFMPRVLESFGVPTALTKRIRSLAKEEDLTSEMLLESSITLKDIVLISNALEKIVETTPDDVIESSNKKPEDGKDGEKAENDGSNNQSDQNKSQQNNQHNNQRK